VEIKAGSADIAILVKLRLLGVVQTLAEHQAQYGAPTTIVYKLFIQSIDKTTIDTSITSDTGLSTVDGIFFLLPSTLFDTENTVLRASLQFQYDTVIDHAKHNFEIKVTKRESPNTK